MAVSTNGTVTGVIQADQAAWLASSAAVGLNTVALIGDSRMAFGFAAGIQTQQQGYFTNLNALLGDRFNVVGRFAVGGKTLKQVLSEQIPQVLALNPLPKYCFMEAGHNTIAPSIENQSGEQAIVDWLAVYTALHNAGIVLIQSTSLPSSLITTTKALRDLAVYNRYLLGQNFVHAGFFCFDGHAAAVDPSTGQYLAARAMVDLVHPNYEGAWQVARLGFSFLDPIIPKTPRLTSQPNAYSQLLGNPTGSGTGGTISGSLTGSLPASWQGGSTGVGAAAASLVAKSDARTGTVTRLTFSAGTAATDLCYVEAGRPQIQGWLANTTITAGFRIRPTVANGYHYLVTTGGLTANAGDPTAGWSTTLGASVTDGAATMLVVEAIDVGDTVEFVAEIVAANFNSLPGTIRLNLAFYTLASAFISQVWGNYADGSFSIPSSAGGAQILRTIPVAIPATTGKIIARVQVIAQSGAVIDVGALEVVKRTTG